MAAYTPSVAEVAAIVPQRADQTSGTFDGTTTPTSTQVSNLTTLVQGQVEEEVGTIPAEATTAAKFVIAIGVASWIELSFYPDLQGGSESPAAMLQDRFEKALAKLRSLVADINSGGTSGGADDVPLPVFGYPTVDTGAPITSWSTRF